MIETTKMFFFAATFDFWMKTVTLFTFTSLGMEKKHFKMVGINLKFFFHIFLHDVFFFEGSSDNNDARLRGLFKTNPIIYKHCVFRARSQHDMFAKVG